MKKYYVTGVPGIGKTTLVNALVSKGIKAYDIDYVPGLCCWVNRSTKEPVEFLHGANEEWHKLHGWECNVDKLKEFMDSKSGEQLFMCGISSNQEEYLDLFDKVFLLQANEQVFLDRMASRDEQHFGYHEDDRKTVLTWYKEFEKTLLDKGAIPIDASLSIEDLVDKILAYEV